MNNPEDFPEAVVTEGQKILFVGNVEEAEKLVESSKTECEYIDLKGKTMMPGFVDGHSHFFQTAQSINMCDLSSAEAFTDLEEILKKYIIENEIDSEGVVLGSGYDHNFLKEQCHPTKEILDRVSESIPIYISHISGHMGVCNSALLSLAGINESTPNPKGGKFGRDKEGKLTGYVEETPALMQVLMTCMKRIKMDMPAQIQKAQELYFRYGVTTTQEGAVSKLGMEALAALANAGLLKIDVVAYVLSEEYKETIQSMPRYGKEYINHVKIGGSKIILDGSPQGKSAWLSMPYEGETEYCGYPTHDDIFVKEAIVQAEESGYQILAHCNGDAASEQFLKCYEEVLKDKHQSSSDLRPVMIHCQTVRDDQLDRMKTIQMIPSIFIGHTYYWGDVHLKNLGENRGNHISPVKEALNRGLVYNFHQDTPVTKPDMLHSVWCAVNRMTRNGQSIGKDQCICVYDALKGITINAAYEYREEEKKGTIESGKCADFVILDQNPLQVSDVRKITVVETIKDGEMVYRKS